MTQAKASTGESFAIAIFPFADDPMQAIDANNEVVASGWSIHEIECRIEWMISFSCM